MVKEGRKPAISGLSARSGAMAIATASTDRASQEPACSEVFASQIIEIGQ